MPRFILTMLMALMLLPAMAQSGLHSNRFFKEMSQLGSNGLQVSEISGDALKNYNLSYYHGLSMVYSKADLDYAVSLIEQDARNASDVEKSYRNGKLAFCILSFEGNGVNRYLIFSSTQKGKIPKITLVYAEGKATGDDIRRMLKKR